jgi:queuine tRNA-ribosyltransferase
MGVGSPEDLIHGIQRGVDIFDCVLPTRLARHTSAMTRTGRINLMNAVNARDCAADRRSLRLLRLPELYPGLPAPPDCRQRTAGLYLISIHNLYTCSSWYAMRAQPSWMARSMISRRTFLENYQRIQAEEA